MPIMLDDIASASIAPKKNTYSPTYFDRELTGGLTKAGVPRKSGVLGLEADPNQVKPGVRKLLPADIDVAHTVVKNAGTTSHQLPIDLIPKSVWDVIEKVEVPDDLDAAIHLADKLDGCGQVALSAYLKLEMHSIVLDIEPKNGRSLRQVWRCEVWFVDEDARRNRPRVKKIPLGRLFDAMHLPSASTLAMGFAADVSGVLQKTVTMFINAPGWSVDVNDVFDQYSNVHTYNAVSRAANMWQTAIDERLIFAVDHIMQPTNGIASDYQSRAISQLMHRLEGYPVSLAFYRPIYDHLQQTLPADMMSEIVKTNLNLLLTDTMTKLDAVKPNLTRCPVRPGVTADPFFNREQAAAIESHDPLIMIQSVAGSGKALPLDEPVLTEDGWKPMGDLTMSDRVAGSDGRFHSLKHIIDQGVRPGYLFTFYDGSSVRCDEEHLWTFSTSKSSSTLPKTKTAREWAAIFEAGQWYAPQVKPIDFPERDLPVDPYLLGALIADGSLHLTTIDYAKCEQSVIDEVDAAAKRCGHSLVETTCENQTVRHFHISDDVTGTRHFTRLRNEIDGLGLRVKSREKFIPEAYMMASPSQRMELVRGLFDGDGSVRPSRGYAQYTTASPQLAQDVLQLLWSLGTPARMAHHDHPRGEYWSIKVYDPAFNPFKASYLKDRYKGSKKRVLRTLVSVEAIEPVPMRCIEIDSDDHLFVTKDYVLTHNSSTIRGRIQFMIDSGVEPHDITVLSFTNAAADHIKDICPGVNSMTISSMVHTIYSENFDHELSSIPTLCNTLDIYYPMNGLATTFKRYLKNTLECEPDAFTRLNTFVENNYDAIVDMLDTCRQTTLELEIIMCYQHIGQYKEPAAVASRHLIVDEVQDNSIFDFIYTLEYCVKHLESLYIVGDASQTLFEFRAANPRALNIMESSGVFTTYKLQINYRSNQSILDFANVMLDDIEANQFAHLRLQSNDLAPVTSASLAEKVRMQSVRVKNAAELRAIGPNLARVYLKPYIDKCLARGEHVCVLGHTRMEVNTFTEALQELYPSRTVENISPSRTYDTTILSRYISRDWNQIRLFDRDKLVGQLVHYLTDNADTYVYPRRKPAIEAAKRMVLKWAGAASEVVKQWSYAVDAHRMGENEFYEKVKDHMLDFEIRANAQNKNVASQKNRQRRESIDFSAIDIVTSTIHSAKGLEFDNVVVLYHDLEGPGEDDKRMYYVALTRAMNTEFILAWSPRETKVIQEAYDNLLAGFQEQEDDTALADESGCEA